MTTDIQNTYYFGVLVSLGVEVVMLGIKSLRDLPVFWSGFFRTGQGCSPRWPGSPTTRTRPWRKSPLRSPRATRTSRSESASYT